MTSYNKINPNIGRNIKMKGTKISRNTVKIENYFSEWKFDVNNSRHLNQGRWKCKNKQKTQTSVINYFILSFPQSYVLFFNFPVHVMSISLSILCVYVYRNLALSYLPLELII